MIWLFHKLIVNQIQMQVKILKYSLVAISILLIFRVNAQDSLSLVDALKLGLENNYQIQITKSNLEIAKNNNSWGEAGLFPSLELSTYQSNRHDEGPNQLTGQQQEYSTNILAPSISMNWLLFGGYAVQLSKKNLALLEQNSESSSALVVENTIQAIILAYYKILMEEEKLIILNQIMTLSRDRFDYMQVKKNIGNAVTYDVLQAQNAYLSDSSAFLLQQMSLRTANMNLNLLMAENADKKFVLTDRFSDEETHFNLDDLKANMLSNNKTLRNQYINQQLLQNNVKLSQSGLYPSIGMSSAYDLSTSRLKYVGMDAISGDAYDYYINFSLNFNLFNGGKTRRAIANAKIAENIGNLQLEELEQNMIILLTTQYDLYSIRKQLLAVAKENTKSTKLNLDISEDKFKTGAINSFNLRDIQLLYLNTAFRDLESTYDLIQSKTELLRISGGIISEFN